MSENSIEIKSLHKSYRLGKHSIPVLRDINLKIKKGQFVSIIGPSGSGKSTLLHLIGGLDHSTHGSIHIDGQSLSKLNDQEISRFRNQKIGFVFQDFNLLENLTVEENIALPLLIQSGSNSLSKLEQESVTQMLKDLDLLHRAKHRPAEISGGQKQRTAIGRALITNPEIIMADEPTGNLDSQTGKQIIKLLKDNHQQRKITLIIITHDHNIASLADHIIQIQDGIITVGKPSTHKFTH
jgi:putative ABC transport system ATP-binding protein